MQGGGCETTAGTKSAGVARFLSGAAATCVPTHLQLVRNPLPGNCTSIARPVVRHLGVRWQ